MEYYRTMDGQIQADLSRRLGIVLKQYHEQVLVEPKYEVTLTLSVLQTLLTNCTELANAIPVASGFQDPFKISPIPKDLINPTEIFITQNTFAHPNLSTMDVIRHMRNALSHPTKQNTSPDKYPTTGYTTSDTDTQIERIIFTTSPDISHGRIKEYRDNETAQSVLARCFQFFPEGISLVGERKKTLALNGEPFYRVFQIEFTPQSLLNFTYSLTQYLAAPLKKTFLSEPIKILRLAA